jgi:acyl-CoA thioesterase YciA
MTTLLLPTEAPLARVTPRPNDANSKGDIFGGWLMSQMDMAGAVLAIRHAQGSIATVAVKDMHFIKPVFIHDVVSFYGEVTAMGKTSVTIHLTAYAERFAQHFSLIEKVSDAIFIYVAIAKPGEKRTIQKPYS